MWFLTFLIIFVEFFLVIFAIKKNYSLFLNSGGRIIVFDNPQGPSNRSKTERHRIVLYRLQANNRDSFKIAQKTAFEAKGGLYTTGKVIPRLFIINLHTQSAIYGYR